MLTQLFLVAIYVFVIRIECTDEPTELPTTEPTFIPTEIPTWYPTNLRPTGTCCDCLVPNNNTECAADPICTNAVCYEGSYNYGPDPFCCGEEPTCGSGCVPKWNSGCVDIALDICKETSSEPTPATTSPTDEPTFIPTEIPTWYPTNLRPTGTCCDCLEETTDTECAADPICTNAVCYEGSYHYGPDAFCCGEDPSCGSGCIPQWNSGCVDIAFDICRETSSAPTAVTIQPTRGPTNQPSIVETEPPTGVCCDCLEEGNAGEGGGCPGDDTECEDIVCANDDFCCCQNECNKQKCRWDSWCVQAAEEVATNCDSDSDDPLPTECNDKCEAFSVSIINTEETVNDNNEDIICLTYEVNRLFHTGICKKSVKYLILGICDDDSYGGHCNDNDLNGLIQDISSDNLDNIDAYGVRSDFQLTGIRIDYDDDIDVNATFTLCLSNVFLENEYSSIIRFRRGKKRFTCDDERHLNGLPCLDDNIFVSGDYGNEGNNKNHDQGKYGSNKYGKKYHVKGHKSVINNEESGNKSWGVLSNLNPIARWALISIIIICFLLFIIAGYLCIVKKNKKKNIKKKDNMNNVLKNNNIQSNEGYKTNLKTIITDSDHDIIGGIQSNNIEQQQEEDDMLVEYDDEYYEDDDDSLEEIGNN